MRAEHGACWLSVPQALSVLLLFIEDRVPFTGGLFGERYGSEPSAPLSSRQLGVL